MIFFSAHEVCTTQLCEGLWRSVQRSHGGVYLLNNERAESYSGINNEHTIAYQSRVGHLQWLRPYTDEVIVELGKKRVKNILAVPVKYSFIKGLLCPCLL